MSELNRRRFLTSLALTVVAGAGAAGCASSGSAPTLAAAPHGRSAPPRPRTPSATFPELLPPPPASARIALPGNGILDVLPGKGDLLALTLDDGVDSGVVRLYTQFAKDTGVRLTYFVNGTYRSWTDNVALLRPLVESGQIQLGNHTWSHPDLTRVPAGRIRDEVLRNHQFLTKTYGVDATPYLRPPYGKHNAAVRVVTGGLGYTVTTMWKGTLADSSVVTEDFIIKMANQYFVPQAIVIGHLNHPPVTHVYPRLVDVIRSRNLRTVTLDDVFVKPHASPK